jgi:hypothetical protein
MTDYARVIYQWRASQYERRAAVGPGECKRAGG